MSIFHRLVVLSWIWIAACPAAASDLAPPDGKVAHDLMVRLIPAAHLLEGDDTISLVSGSESELTLTLADAAEIDRITVNGKPRHVRREDALVFVPVSANERKRPLTIRAVYRIVFDDPYPSAPANTDNPGYGVSGTISAEGALLLGGSGWYPDVPGGSGSFNLAVSAPEGIVAVTGGRFLGATPTSIHGETETLSKWRIDAAPEPLALSAGPYVVTDATSNGIDVMTFFYPETQPLATRYLAASGDYLRLYESLFGPYPFEKFAVVENFFPTGYGFPSYTLMGSVVLRLPFIIRTSLGHEIAHSWWGNGVLIDSAEGNWCEGLATYVADYLYSERKSARDAMEYRRQWLRNFAALVDAGTDFPLSRFMSRTDPVSKVIGYDKGAMVFHMLRQRVGDDFFWISLRTLYNARLFKPTTWSDIRAVFEQTAGMALAEFFNQWVGRTGAPEIRLADVDSEKHQGAWRVRGAILQTGIPYDLKLPIRVTTASGDHDATIHANAARVSFQMDVPNRPEGLTVDPDSHVFRKLFPEEVPPTVNHLKNAADPLLVVATDASDAVMGSARLFIRAMGMRDTRIVRANRLAARDLKSHDVIWFGLPEKAFQPPAFQPVGASGGFRFMDEDYALEDGALFCAMKHPFDPDKVAALLLSGEASIAAVVRKIPHYGKYSYLTFVNGINRDKGTWEVRQSPLVVRF